METEFIRRKSRRFSRTEFDRRVLAKLGDLSLYVATVEDVILAKLEWAKLGGSQRQLEDVAGLLPVRGPDLDLAYMDRWIGELAVTAEWKTVQRMAQSFG